MGCAVDLALGLCGLGLGQLGLWRDGELQRGLTRMRSWMRDRGTAMVATGYGVDLEQASTFEVTAWRVQ